MRIRILTVYLFLLAIMGLPFLAQAGDFESSLIVDQAGVFSGSGISEVEEAAQELQNVGADVHIWTIPYFPRSANNMDDYFEDNLLDKFPSWQAPRGGKKNNLVVLIISIEDRETGLYYGEEWEMPLDNNWIGIQTKFMNPKFKRGDFAGGFVSGIREIKNLIYDHLHPSSMSAQPLPSNQVTVVKENGEVETVSSNSPVVVVKQSAPSKPTDLGGLWTVLKLMLVAVFITLIFIFTLVIVRKQNKTREERQEAQQKAKIQKNSASKAISESKQMIKELDEIIAILKSNIHPKLYESFSDRLCDIKLSLFNITQNFSSTSSSAGDPENETFTEAQYRAIEDKFSEITKPVYKLINEINNFNEALKKIRGDILTAPKLISEVENDFEETEKLIQAISGKGFKVAKAEEALKEGGALIKEAKKFLADKFIPEVEKKTEEAKMKLLDAQKKASDLSEIKAMIDEEIKRMEERGLIVFEEIGKGREAFERINEEFVPGSLESIQGNGMEAQKRLGAANVLVEEAKVYSSMEIQEWEKAEECLQKADDFLSKAASLMKSIVNLEINLNEAKNNVDAEISEVESDIKKAWEYVRMFDDDIQEKLEEDLFQAEILMNKVKEELLKEKPDYIVAFKKAQMANNMADRIFEQATNEHESAERERKKLKAQKQSAKAAISRAEEYFEDHNGDIEESAKKHLKAARKTLKDAESQGNVSELLLLMALCQKEADNAYKLAQSDVSSATSSRNISWGSRDDDDDWSSGINIGGGGGSTNWGGFGGGGGGSTKW